VLLAIQGLCGAPSSAHAADAEARVLILMSGVELRSRLAAGGSTIPVVFITAYDDDKTRATRSVNLGAMEQVRVACATPGPYLDGRGRKLAEIQVESLPRDWG